MAGTSVMLARPTTMATALSSSSAICGRTSSTPGSLPEPALVTLHEALRPSSAMTNARATTGAEPMLVTIADGLKPPHCSQVTRTTSA